ncbi:MAG TPA: 30S ribosomal protein S4, partial [Alphaproteobacteria bacterium]|nr:30S ribosomal protein S4 [Alphaproteobacteria bacterium]
MTKRIESKYKIDRRLGVNLWGRPKSPLNTRAYGPGQHGQRRSKPSDYGLQLTAKQKLKGYYGNITERQFRRLYAEAIRRRGDTSENLIGLLESRLDAVVYRMKFVPTVFASRQFVNHGHVLVNGKRVNIPSYLVKAGDVIEVRPKSKELALVLESVQLAERDIPEYLEVDHKGMKGTYVRVPTLLEVP